MLLGRLFCSSSFLLVLLVCKNSKKLIYSITIEFLTSSSSLTTVSTSAYSILRISPNLIETYHGSAPLMFELARDTPGGPIF